MSAFRTPHESKGGSLRTPPVTISSAADHGLALPLHVLHEAIKAVPSVKYALGISGIVASIAIIQAFRIGYRIAFFGTIAIFILMVLLVIFARLTRTAPKYFLMPAMVLMWSFLLLTIATAVLLFTSIFFRIPIDLRNWLKPDAATDGPRLPDTSLSALLSTGEPGAPAQSSHPVEFGFEVLARREGTDAFVPLHDGDELASTVDDYCLVFSPSTPGFLYVLQQDSSGHIQWLFPGNETFEFSSGINPVHPGQSITLPADSHKALFLDATPGTETIIAVYSANRWLELESALKTASKASAEAGGATRLYAATRGVGGIRQAPSASSGSSQNKNLEGKMYRLPAPLELDRSSGDFLVVRRTFKHVNSSR